MSARTTDALDSRPHSVYWLYDIDGYLVYVGCARDVEYRIYLHMAPSTQSETSREIQRRGIGWWESDEYPTKAEARAAERAAIAADRPLLNKQHARAAA